MSTDAKNAKLSPLQQKFAELYVQTSNATQSYIDAGYKAKNREVATSSASALLIVPKVREYVAHLKEELKKTSLVTAADLIQKATEIAFSDMNEVVHVVDGKLELKEGVKDLNQFDGLSATYSFSESSSEKNPTDKGGGGSSQSSSETKSFSVKRADRNKALDTLAKLIGAYELNDETGNGRNLSGSNKRFLSALGTIRKRLDESNKPEGEK